MPRILAATWVLTRVAFCLIGIYGLGQFCSLALRKMGSNRVAGAPTILLGLSAAIAIPVLLSLPGLLFRTPLILLLFAGATYWALTSSKSSLQVAGSWLRKNLGATRNAGLLRAILTWLSVGMVLFLATTNLLRAIRPNDHLDPLITYAVQPDRWLQAGRIYWLDETVFSGLPKAGEIITLWPASLADSRIDGISVLQAFEMAILLLAVYLAGRRLKLGLNRFLLCLLAVISCNMLVGWASIAKPDMLAVLFFTMAATGVSGVAQDGALRLWPFLCFGLAAAVKPTVWVGLPAFALLSLVHLRQRGATLKDYTLAFILAVSVPLAFALRTWLATGTPFYPFSVGFFTVNSDWVRHDVPALVNAANQARGSVPRNVVDLLRAWAPIAYVSALALFCSLPISSKRSARLRWVFPILLIVMLGAIAFRPTAWGAKYTSFALVWVSAVSAARIRPRHISYFALALLLTIVAATEPLARRLGFLGRFISSTERLSFPTDMAKSPRDLHLWMNDNLNDEDAKVLSIYSPERYFSDFPIYCAWRHPRFDRLYLENNAPEEAEILSRERIDYVYFDPDRPVHLELLNWRAAPNATPPHETLEFLEDSSYVRLDPVIYVTPYLLCRVER